MLILVMGRNGSGKSAYAEKLAVRLGQPRFYIATMLPDGTEGAARVQRHREQRAGLGFQTLELPYAVGGADIPAHAVALVEDMSNLLANARFGRGASAAAVLSDLETLCRRVGQVIAVTISEFDAGSYNKETTQYIEALMSLNQELHARAAVVVEMRDGTPLIRKGALHEPV